MHTTYYPNIVRDYLWYFILYPNGVLIFIEHKSKSLMYMYRNIGIPFLSRGIIDYVISKTMNELNSKNILINLQSNQKRTSVT